MWEGQPRRGPQGYREGILRHLERQEKGKGRAGPGRGPPLGPCGGTGPGPGRAGRLLRPPTRMSRTASRCHPRQPMRCPPPREGTGCPGRGPEGGGGRGRGIGTSTGTGTGTGTGNRQQEQEQEQEQERQQDQQQQQGQERQQEQEQGQEQEQRQQQQQEQEQEQEQEQQQGQDATQSSRKRERAASPDHSTTSDPSPQTKVSRALSPTSLGKAIASIFPTTQALAVPSLQWLARLSSGPRRRRRHPQENRWQRERQHVQCSQHYSPPSQPKQLWKSTKKRTAASE